MKIFRCFICLFFVLVSFIFGGIPVAWGASAVTDQITNSATAKLVSPAASGQSNYLSGLTIAHATLGAVTDFCIRSVPVASTTATIAADTLVMAASYNWSVGDLIYVTASTVTGLTAGEYYYIHSVSGPSLTFTAAIGSTVATISGTAVAATLSKVLFRSQLQTTALPIKDILIAREPKGGLGLALEAVTVTAVTGRVDFNIYTEVRN